MGLLDRFKDRGQEEKWLDGGDTGAAPVSDASGQTIGSPLEADGLLSADPEKYAKPGEGGSTRADLEAMLYQARAGGDPELVELVELEIRELEARGEG
jgi:hypothetical protein